MGLQGQSAAWPLTVKQLAALCTLLRGLCSCGLCFHVAFPEVPPLKQVQLPQLVCIPNELGMEPIRSPRPRGAVYTSLDSFQAHRLCGMCKLRKSRRAMAVTGTYTMALAHARFLLLFLASISQFYCSERQTFCIFKTTL